MTPPTTPSSFHSDAASVMAGTPEMDEESTRDVSLPPQDEDELRASEEPMEIDIPDTIEESEEPQQPDAVPKPKAKRDYNRKPAQPVVYEREPGKSVLPLARVQKIIKADKDISIVTKDATLLISLATEEFIRRICDAGSKAAHRENRSTVQGRDIATAVRRVDEFLFLEDILPLMIAPEPKRTSKVKQLVSAPALKGAPTLLDQFVGKKQPIEEEGGESEESGED